MTRSAYGERWLDLGADPVLGPLLAGERTSRAEVAACRRVEGAGNVTGQLDPVPSMVGVGHRDGREQRRRIGMQRVLVQLGRGSQLNDLPQVHDGNSVADVSER